MRQIPLGAWLFLTCSAGAACSGAEFSSGDQERGDPSANGSGTEKNDGTAGRSGGGSSGASKPGDNQAGSKTVTGGGANTGGSSAGAAAGGTGNAGGPPVNVEDCAVGSVTFKMVPEPGMADGYLCDAGCGSGWLTLTDAAGASAFPIVSACGTASCDSCEIAPCAAAACLPTPLTAKGSTLTWNGTYLMQDTCGAKLACQRQTCMPPGKYKAKACAALSAGDADTGEGCLPRANATLCAEVEFEFPETDAVELVLKAN